MVINSGRCKVCRKKVGPNEYYCSDLCRVLVEEKCEMCGTPFKKIGKYFKKKIFCDKCTAIIQKNNEEILAGKNKELLREDYYLKKNTMTK